MVINCWLPSPVARSPPNVNIHLHFNADLILGRACVERLKLKPDDHLGIHLENGQIRLVPITKIWLLCFC